MSHEVQIYVNNLPGTYQWQELKQLFSKAGQVIRATVVSLPNGQSRRFGTVLFATADEARAAIELFNGYNIDDTQLHVKYDRYASSKQSSIINSPMLASNAIPSAIHPFSMPTLDHIIDVDTTNCPTIHDPLFMQNTLPLNQHYINDTAAQLTDSSSNQPNKGTDWYMTSTLPITNSIPIASVTESNRPVSHWISPSSIMTGSDIVSNANHSIFYTNYHNVIHQPSSITHLPINLMPHYHPVTPVQSPPYLPMSGHPLAIPSYYMSMPIDANHHYHGPHPYYLPVYAVASTPSASMYPLAPSLPINSSQSNEHTQTFVNDMIDPSALYGNQSSIPVISETATP